MRLIRALKGTTANSVLLSMLCRFRKRLGAVDEWMQQIDIPEHLESAVYEYYSTDWLRQQEQQELWTACLEDLPHQLRADVSYSLVGPTLRKLEVFKGFSASQLMQVSEGEGGAGEGRG